MSQTAAAPQISGKLYLFQQPELLNREQHQDLGINPPTAPFAYAAKVRAAPITVSEIGIASKNFPIVFTGKTGIVPLAVLGVIDEVNLFVDEKGLWDPEVYVPGYLQRYPFAFASESGGERFALVIDRAYEHIRPGAKEPFFKDGAPSDAMQNVIEFCKRYESERMMTEQLMKSLEEFDLISGQAAQVAPAEGGEQKTFAQYFGVDAQKFDALSDEKFLELRRKGLLPVIYAQLMSAANWRTLFLRRGKRYGLSGPAVFEPVKVS